MAALEHSFIFSAGMLEVFDWVGITQEQLTEQFNKTNPQLESPTTAGLINAFVKVIQILRPEANMDEFRERFGWASYNDILDECASSEGEEDFVHRLNALLQEFQVPQKVFQAKWLDHCSMFNLDECARRREMCDVLSQEEGADQARIEAVLITRSQQPVPLGSTTAWLPLSLSLCTLQTAHWSVC